MRILLQGVLTRESVDRVNALIAGDEFVAGQATSTLVGKNNLQLPSDSPASGAAGRLVLDALGAHETFQRAVLPHYVHPPLFSRYEPGMEYPRHIDNAIMVGRRCDVSVTLFLGDPDSYEGGELVIDSGSREHSYRLAAGDAIAYPTTMFHRVARVTRGSRLAAVVWVQSLVRDAALREVLDDLAVTRDAIGDGVCQERLRRSHANLLRLWADT
jgi:PKHD-type hydroxylase